MHLSKSARIAALLVGASIALAGCSSTATKSTTTQITYLSFYDPKPVNVLISQFEKVHPDIKVTYQSVPIANLSSTIQNRLANKGASPDVYNADQPTISSLESKGFLSDVSADLKGKSATSIWLKSAVDASTVNGKLMALPVNTSSAVLYYNADLLKKAGIALPSPDPTKRYTWAELTELAKKAQAAGAKWGMGFDQVNTYYQLQSLSESAGGGSGLTGAENLKPNITNSGWKTAMAAYGNLFSTGISARGMTGSETSAAFAAGQMAFMLGGTQYVNLWKATPVPFSYGIAAEPAIDTSKAATPTGAFSLGINPNSKNSKAANEFATWITTTKQGMTDFLNVDSGIPAQISSIAPYFSAGKWNEVVDGYTPGKLVASELANTAVPRPVSVGYVQFEAIINKGYADIANGQPVSATLTATQQQLSQVLGQVSSK